MKEDLKFLSDSVFDTICLIMIIGFILICGTAILSILKNSLGVYPSIKHILIGSVIIGIIAGWIKSVKKSMKEYPELYKNSHK